MQGQIGVLAHVKELTCNWVPSKSPTLKSPSSPQESPSTADNWVERAGFIGHSSQDPLSHLWVWKHTTSNEKQGYGIFSSVVPVGVSIGFKNVKRFLDEEGTGEKKDQHHQKLEMAEGDSEILQLLKNNDLHLQKRINLARNAFISNHLPAQTKDQVIGSKEEICVEWLCCVLEKDVGNSDAWEALKQCLCSDRMNTYKLYVSPSTRTLIVSTLCKFPEREDVGQEGISTFVTCCVQLTENPIFIQHFNKTLSDYSMFMNTMLRSLRLLRNDCFENLCQKLSCNLITFTRKFYLNDAFRDYFSRNILLPLSLILENEGQSLEKYEDFVKEFYRCIHLTLFPRKNQKEEYERMTQLFSQLLKGAEGSAKSEVLLFQILYDALMTLSSNDFISILSVAFKSYISSCSRDAEKHCQTFLMLCYLLGFKPVVLDSRPGFSDDVSNFFSLPAILHPKKKLPNIYLKVLIGVMNKANVNINAEVAGYPFVGWLRGLCDCIISGVRSIDDSTISVFTALSELDPNILDAHTLRVIGPVMLKRSKKSKRVEKCDSAYSLFLNSLLHSSVKLHRLQKLASRLLSSAKEELNRDPSIGSKVTVEDAFPQQFCVSFRESMQHLVATQALAMLRTLMFHLLEDCVIPMENGRCDSSAILLLQLTKCLLCEFMVGYKAIDPNIPELQVEKFTSLMSELGGCLGRLGRALLLEKHNPGTMGAFLELSHCWGDLHLLLVFYQPDKPSGDPMSAAVYPKLPSMASTKFCGTPGSLGTATDFSCLHPHLSEGEWSHLVERIVNFGDDACKELQDELVLQKLRTVALFEPRVKADTKAHPCIQHLLSRAGESPHALTLLVQNQAVIVPLLDLADVTQFLHVLMSDKLVRGSESHFKALCGNPSVVPVATLSLLKQMGDNAFQHQIEKKSLKRKHNECLEQSPCIGGEPRLKRVRWAKRGLILSQELLRSVAETVSGMVEAYGEVLADGKLQHWKSTSFEGLPQVIASKLREYLESYSSDAEGNDDAVPLSVDASVLHQLLNTLGSLPLPHLSESTRIVVSLCMVGLLMVSREHSQLDEWVQVEILSTKALLMTVKAFNVFRELVSYLDIGSFLAWYISGTDSDAYSQSSPEACREVTQLQEDLMARMVDISMSRTAGLNQMKTAVTAIKERLKDGNANVDQICHLSSLLMSAFSKKCKRASSEKLPVKQLCSKYNASIASCLLRRVDFSPSKITKQRMVCFHMALQTFSSLKDQKRLSKAGGFLEGIVEVVKTRLMGDGIKGLEEGSPGILSVQSAEFESCSIELIEILLSMRVQLKKWCPPLFAWSMWQLLISSPNCELNKYKLFSKAVKTLLLSANKKEFELLSNDLLEKMATLDPASPDPGLLQRYMVLWEMLVQVPLVKGLDEIRRQSLKSATPMFLALIRNWGDLPLGPSVAQAVVPTLEFGRVLLRSHKVSVDHHMIDLVLESISASPIEILPLSASEGNSRELLEFQRVFLSCSNALLALVTHQLASMIDRIPSFVQQLLRLFRSVVVHGNVEFNPTGGLQGGKLSESLLIMTDCAISIEWISNALVRHKKDFTRVSPYFIADVVSSFEDHIVHPNVKAHLHNCIYVFIYFCDASGLAYLQHALPSGSREIFKSIFENYKKYYKFKGKI
ncbi:uncharacterized protein [Hetaerina americana]|uniref:uncharacterized protein n=1 Tax=Hetaerina americana TaxID=62018 RepID=UPI003A7F1B40